MTISELGSATKLDLLVADTQGQIKYTVLKPSKRGVKALSGKRAWSNAAPKGSFMHGSVAGTPGVTNNNKCNQVMWVVDRNSLRVYDTLGETVWAVNSRSYVLARGRVTPVLKNANYPNLQRTQIAI